MPEISAQQLELLFELFPECLCIFTTDGELSKVNPAFCRMTGYTEIDLTTQPFIDFIHPDDRFQTVSKIQKLQFGELPDVFECRFLLNNAGYKWISWNCFMPGKDGSSYCSIRNVSTSKDIEVELLKANQENKTLLNSLRLHSKRRAEEELLHFNGQIDYIIENCADCFFTINKEWKILAVNQKARKLLNLSNESVRHANFDSIFPLRKDHHLFSEAKKAFKTRKTTHFEEFYPHLNKWMEVTAYPHAIQ